MPLDWESAAGGTGGGVLGAILTWLGLKQRLDRIDSEMLQMRDNIQYKATCDAKHTGMEHMFETLEKKVDYIISRIDDKKTN